MSEAGENTHKRSKSSSSRLSRLRRKDHRDDDATHDELNNNTLTPAPPTVSGDRLSTSSIPSRGDDHSALTSFPPPPADATVTSHTPALKERTLTLEQSVRKFRIVEALRHNDRATIASVLGSDQEGESSQRTSLSSLSSPSGHLDDTTILHLAIQCAEVDMVEYLLTSCKEHVDVNARDKDGNTPLHVAATQGRTQVVRLLLDQEDVNFALPNHQGRFPLDVARNPEIFQMLQLARSLFSENKTKQIQRLVAARDLDGLVRVLEETLVKAILDINDTEFVTDPTTAESGGSLLHEAARARDTGLIQVLLRHGADPFKRDRKGKLPQDVTKDDAVRAKLKRSPEAVAAQMNIQEKAVLGHAASQGFVLGAPGDPIAGKEAREMKGYLKKWTNYRKGYQLRWFVLEDGVLSYYKHQDDTATACRGAINMSIAKLHMSPDEKTKFEIIGKSSVKYTLRANHEVEAKRWFWALNNAIQWTKDQAKEKEQQRVREADLLRQAKEASVRGSSSEIASSNTSVASPATASKTSLHRPSVPSTGKGGGSESLSRPQSQQQQQASGAPSVDDQHSLRTRGEAVEEENVEDDDDEDDDDEDDDDSTRKKASAASKDALGITAQSAKLQLDMMMQVNAALIAEASRHPHTPLSDSLVSQALSTYQYSASTLSNLVADLLKLSKDQETYWQRQLDREVHLRRMWEESMAQVAREQELLEARIGKSEEKRRLAKRALKEVLETASAPTSPDVHASAAYGDIGSTMAAASGAATGSSSVAPGASTATPPVSTPGTDRSGGGILYRRPTALGQIGDLSDSESEADDEFFDAVDSGQVEVLDFPETSIIKHESEAEEKDAAAERKTDSATTGDAGDDSEKGGPSSTVAIRTKARSASAASTSDGVNISSSFLGYENGIRSRLKMENDDRPKISLWGILKSMIGKDMSKMTLPVSFNEPTSLLYRCGEDMEYADLLDLAADRTESMERLIYVGAFAASEYASTIGRVAKPFNPLLGETFEYVRPDKNYRFFIEQVSHHPPIGAAWAESPKWTYYGESSVRSKFYGKSFDINPLGTWFLKLRPSNGGPEELYTWKKVTSSVIGIITGNPTVDNYGTMEIKNWTTGEVCTIEFKPRGWKASSAYQVSGKIVDAQGRVCVSLGGRWNSKLYARMTPGYEATVDGDSAGASASSTIDPNKVFLIWQAHERPNNIPFNLTPFVLTFNHIDDKLRPWIAPTDSRLRPDQRAMEEGEYDFAAEEKNRLEEAQRARRRRREAKGEEFTPAWFRKARCELTGEEFWQFSGEYWKRRELAGPEGDPSKAWAGLEPIFDDVKPEENEAL